jgi:3-phenylpropionate/trans-cinnamate dioxygenase ferredoxin reductase subunit
MSDNTYDYVIIGGGLAGASAVEGIREVDGKGRVLLIGAEKHLPYHRPPLSKNLWSGKQNTADIFVHDESFYTQQKVSLALGTTAVALDAQTRQVSVESGHRYKYGKLLLATGGEPRMLPITGGDLDGICYYRQLDDYLRVRRRAAEGKTVVVIGGGFIGSELAAALTMNKLSVKMVFPDAYLCSRVFPEQLGRIIQQIYVQRGIEVLAPDKPISFTREDERFVTRTEGGRELHSDLVVVGIGIAPATDLAKNAGIDVGNGILVNEYLQSCNPHIYAAGDNALFPNQLRGQQTRIEHWDNALHQGKCAGRNMAGAREQFVYEPYFFSDLFEFGYEAVGEVSSQLETFSDWQKGDEKGVIYYLRGGKVRGVMMCNVWDKVDVARDLIRKGEIVAEEALRGLIR